MSSRQNSSNAGSGITVVDHESGSIPEESSEFVSDQASDEIPLSYGPSSIPPSISIPLSANTKESSNKFSSGSRYNYSEGNFDFPSDKSENDTEIKDWQSVDKQNYEEDKYDYGYYNIYRRDSIDSRVESEEEKKASYTSSSNNFSGGSIHVNQTEEESKYIPKWYDYQGLSNIINDRNVSTKNLYQNPNKQIKAMRRKSIRKIPSLPHNTPKLLTKIKEDEKQKFYRSRSEDILFQAQNLVPK